MEMIEVSMRNQHYVDGREIGDAQAWTAQALQHEEPAREVRIDDYAPAANLYEEAGVADESDAQFSVRGKSRLTSLAPARSYRRVAHQTSELRSAFAKGRVAKRLLNHPAAEPWG